MEVLYQYYSWRPSIDATFQVSDHLAKRFQRRRFSEIDQSEARIACGGHLISFQSVNKHVRHRQFLFLIGLFLKISSETVWPKVPKLCRMHLNQKQELPVTDMFVNGLERNEQSQQRTFHRCFLPIVGTFGQTVSDEKIFQNQPIRNKNRLWRPCLLMDRVDF
jgi:hypothetical protein